MTFTIYERRLDVWRERPALAVHIATINQIWARIEYELALMFVILSGSRLPLGRVFDDVIGMPTRLRMLQTLVTTYLPESDKVAYQTLRKRVSKASGKRNGIVHGTWSIRDDKPDVIFLDKITFPLTVAEGRAPVPYTTRRFADTEKELASLLDGLITFRSHLVTLA